MNYFMLKRLSYIAVIMLVGLMVPKIALASGPMHLNIHIAKYCGNWEIIKVQHCASRGKRKGFGGIAYVSFQGGGNGAGTVSFKSKYCPAANSVLTTLGLARAACGRLGRIRALFPTVM